MTNRLELGGEGAGVRAAAADELVGSAAKGEKSGEEEGDVPVRRGRKLSLNIPEKSKRGEWRDDIRIIKYKIVEKGRDKGALEPVEEAMVPIFFNRESYLVIAQLFRYGKAYRCVVYAWQGRYASLNSRCISAIRGTEVLNTIQPIFDIADQMRAVQLAEPDHFLALWGDGSMLVLEGDTSDYTIPPALEQRHSALNVWTYITKKETAEQRGHFARVIYLHDDDEGRVAPTTAGKETLQDVLPFLSSVGKYPKDDVTTGIGSKVELALELRCSTDGDTIMFASKLRRPIQEDFPKPGFLFVELEDKQVFLWRSWNTDDAYDEAFQLAQDFFAQRLQEEGETMEECKNRVLGKLHIEKAGCESPLFCSLFPSWNEWPDKLDKNANGTLRLPFPPSAKRT
uniref:Gelsolin-like domain-containing protein n=1 Tax=Palpitomonas bilix TaxID=652834 RepID=A0A7S3DBJ4_9EUKA